MKNRGTRKAYLPHLENSSKEVDDIFKTFLLEGNFDTTTCLNILKETRNSHFCKTPQNQVLHESALIFLKQLKKY